MDLYQFNFHNYEKREAFVWEFGSFICFREEEDYRIVLYNMGNFFAEIWYRVGTNQIELVRGFKNKAALDLIDLSKIMD